MGPTFGEFCSCSCLPLLPQLACSVHSTWGPPISGALYNLSRERRFHDDWSFPLSLSMMVCNCERVLAIDLNESRAVWFFASAFVPPFTDTHGYFFSPGLFRVCLWLDSKCRYCKSVIHLQPLAETEWFIPPSPLSHHVLSSNQSA